MKLKSVQSGFNNVQSTFDFESPVQETSKPQVPVDQTAATTRPVPQQAQNQGTAKEAGRAAHKAAMRLDGKLGEAALRHKLTNSYENGTKGSDALPKKNIDGVRQVMLSGDGAKKFSQIKPVLSEMISRLPGSDSHTENVKANLHELLHMVNIDSSKSKIGPEKEGALNRFTGAVSRAAASINPNSTIPLGTTVKTLIAEVKSTGGAPLPKHVDDGLGKLTDLLDKAHAEKATPDKAQMEGAVRGHTDDIWWKTVGTTSAVVVGVVSAVTGAFTFGASSPAVLPAAAGSGALGTAAGGISAATATFGAAAATATGGSAAAAGVVTTTLAATGGAAAAGAFAVLGPVLTTAATGGVLNEITDLLDSLW